MNGTSRSCYERFERKDDPVSLQDLQVACTFGSVGVRWLPAAQACQHTKPKNGTQEKFGRLRTLQILMLRLHQAMAPKGRLCYILHGAPSAQVQRSAWSSIKVMIQ